MIFSGVTSLTFLHLQKIPPKIVIKNSPHGSSKIYHKTVSQAHVFHIETKVYVRITSLSLTIDSDFDKYLLVVEFARHKEPSTSAKNG